MLVTNIEHPYQITLCNDPFDSNIEIVVPRKGDHPTLGLQLKNDKDIGKRLQLKECLKYNLSTRIPQWLSTLRGEFLVKVNNIKVQNNEDVKN